jgi:hypothetical protein
LSEKFFSNYQPLKQLKVKTMGNNSTKLRYFLFLLLFNIISSPSITQAETNKTLNLSQHLKDILIKSNPILGKNITKATFTDIPILITFFASW